MHLSSPYVRLRFWLTARSVHSGTSRYVCSSVPMMMIMDMSLTISSRCTVNGSSLKALPQVSVRLAPTIRKLGYTDSTSCTLLRRWHSCNLHHWCTSWRTGRVLVRGMRRLFCIAQHTDDLQVELRGYLRLCHDHGRCAC